MTIPDSIYIENAHNAIEAYSIWNQNGPDDRYDRLLDVADNLDNALQDLLAYTHKLEAKQEGG